MMEPVTAAEVQIRDGKAQDLERIVELLSHGALVEGREDPGDLVPYLAALTEIEHGPGGILVAEVGGEVVGVCQLIVFRHLQNRGARCAEVESVHVHPDQRGRGIGHILMAATIDRARDLGCSRVQLTSNVARPDAHRFYEALGFSPSHQGFKLALS
jgi:GNAT superfamily N-acetyltransferase